MSSLTLYGEDVNTTLFLADLYFDIAELDKNDSSSNNLLPFWRILKFQFTFGSISM